MQRNDLVLATGAAQLLSNPLLKFHSRHAGKQHALHIQMDPLQDKPSHTFLNSITFFF